MGEFYNVDIRGKHWLERLPSLPVWAADDEARILFDTTSQQVVFGNASEWIRAGRYGDVPLGATLLIESDVAIIGFSIETDVDDMISYATKGSGAGGGAGGADYVGSTWTQPNHTHTQPTHQHDIGSHVHTAGSHTHTTTAVALSVAQMAAHTHPPQAGFANFQGPGLATHNQSGNSYGFYANTGSAGSGSTHNHGTGAALGNTGSPTGGTDSGAGGGDITGGGASGNTWRPEGRNFTRQTRI